MSLADPASVDELLNFRLARLLGSSGALVIRLCEGRYGITRREWRLIAMLAAHGAMSPSELAEHARIDRARASRVITALVSKRLLERSHPPGDRRRARIDLTESGRRLYAELFPQSASLNKLVVRDLSPALLAAFDQALGQMTIAAENLCRTYPLDLKADRRHGGSRKTAGFR